jgi:hypothetical protein
VSTGVADGDRDVGKGLFRHLHRERGRLARRIGAAPARVRVDRIFGLGRRQPLGQHGTRLHVGFLVPGEAEDEVAVGPEALALEGDERRDQMRHAQLVVADPAAVEEAAFLVQLEWVALPVGALGLDHVHVRQEQQGRLGPGATIADDHRRRLAHRHDLDVARGKARLPQLGRQQPGHARHLAPALDGGHFDDRLEQVVEQPAFGAVAGRRLGRRGCRQEGKCAKESLQHARTKAAAKA